MEAQITILKEQLNSQYARVWEEFSALVQSGETKTLSSYCKATETNYEGLRHWLRVRGISVTAFKQSILGKYPQQKCDTDARAMSFIQFTPSSSPMQSSSMHGISITFPDGVNLSLQEGSAEGIANLLAIYKSRCAAGGV